MKEISAFYDKRVKVSGNLELGTAKTARRVEGRGRVITEDQCRLDLNFSAWAEESVIQVSVWVRKSDQDKVLAAVNHLPNDWFRLQVIYNINDTLRIIRKGHPQEIFRLYPVLYVTSRCIEKR